MHSFNSITVEWTVARAATYTAVTCMDFSIPPPAGRRFSARLPQKKGVSLEAPAFDFAAYRETQYDLLASSVREHLDMKLICQILEEGI